MSEEQTLNILKGAILLERKGKVFYETTARQTKSEAVREVFETMAIEENKHIDILSNHYDSLVKEGKLSSLNYNVKPITISKTVLSKKIKDEISAASFEAAAISAAMALEEGAVRYYSDRANSTKNPLEKELYNWLAQWEKTHLQFLSGIDKELRESVWYDNQFWPEL